ncbi:GNAT family N-acetyltransferase [Guptibacillus hwajinpoensis]|uniref:GNAT family N-acetyltransferase n=1 Tax=Guptibacillus hwajinpoensis TaxID=208199 RepID=UPI00069F5F3F|nr:GNAT family N-acetyltransferase [Alkalihalobacillus macyae]
MIGVHRKEFDGSLVDYLFEWTSSDHKWLLEELGRLPSEEDLISYVQMYEGMGCVFQVWLKNNEPVAITCVLNKAPSNHKPWIGMIVVRPECRREGIGREVIQEITGEFADVVFAGIPYDMNDWSLFLGQSGFEQYGIEKQEKGNYLIFVHPG